MMRTGTMRRTKVCAGVLAVAAMLGTLATTTTTTTAPRPGPPATNAAWPRKVQLVEGRRLGACHDEGSPRSSTGGSLRRSLVLRGGSEANDAGAGGNGGGQKDEQHWLRSGDPPPRYTHALSTPKMEEMMRDLQLNLTDETEAKIDALIRELDRELPPEDEPHAAGADSVRECRERAMLMNHHRPSLYNYAHALHMSGDEAGAVRVYSEAIACAPVTNESSAADRHCVAAACCNLGVLYYGGGGAMPSAELVNYTAAEEMFERALELEPDMVEGMCNLAVLLQGLGQRASSRETIKVDIPRALTLLRRAVELNRDHVPSVTHLAYLLETNMRMYDEAEQLYRRALEQALTFSKVLSHALTHILTSTLSQSHSRSQKYSL
jgi:tetratricopeptide (TPR) repeat protein